MKQDYLSVARTVKRAFPCVVSQFECNAILKGCELIAVGERCDTHGTRSDLILTLKGSHLHRRFDPFRVNENVYPRSVGVPKLAHGY